MVNLPIQSYRLYGVIIARHEAILMRTLVAIVVRLLRRQKSLLAMTMPCSLQFIKNLLAIYIGFYKINYPSG